MLQNLRHILLVLLGLACSTVAQAAKLVVDCNRGTEDALPTISSALSRLNPEGPNTVTVSGSCKENVVIQGVDRLTLIAQPGASVSDASAGNAIVIDISDSQRVTVQGFTINGGIDGVDCHNHSFCHFHGNTIQGSAAEGVSVRDSQADFDGDVLQNHADAGLQVGIKAIVSISNVTLKGNTGDGADVVVGSLLWLEGGNTIQGNSTGVYVDGSSRLQASGAVIKGNSGDGVGLDSSATAAFNPGFSSVVITGNGGHGVSVGNLSFARFASGITVKGNQTSPDVLCFEKFSATAGALTNLGGGTTNCTEAP